MVQDQGDMKKARYFKDKRNGMIARLILGDVKGQGVMSDVGVDVYQYCGAAHEPCCMEHGEFMGYFQEVKKPDLRKLFNVTEI